MSNSLKWQSVTPVEVISNRRYGAATLLPITPEEKVRGIITIPAFSLLNTWLGASHIIAEFNYIASQKFTIEPFVHPQYPNTESFIFVIRYYCTDGSVFRKKLYNQNVSEVLNSVSLYNGEVILPYFTVEIWNVEDYNQAVLSSDFSISLSTRYASTAIHLFNATTTESPVASSIFEADLDIADIPINTSVTVDARGPFIANVI